MSYLRSFLSLPALTVLVVTTLLIPTPARGDFTIQVKNTTGDPAVLDDLTVYGADPTTQSKVILPAGSGTKFLPNEVKMFDTISFKPVKIAASKSGGGESTLFTLGTVSEDVSWLVDPNHNPLFLAIDTSQVNFPTPAVGTAFAFTNGLDPGAPGWFVGTGFNSNTGDVANPYTGSATVSSADFAFALAPETESNRLLLTGLVTIVIGSMARKRQKSTLI